MFKVTFNGNLGSDPEKRYTAKGDAMLTFRVGVNSRRRDNEGEWQNHTDWVRVRCMGSRVDFLADNLHKGMPVVVVGNLEVGTYESRDGDTRVSLDVAFPDEVIVNLPRGEGRRDDDNEPDGVNLSGRQKESNGRPLSAGAQAPKDDLEDLPFNHPRFLDEPWRLTHVWCP